MSLEVLSYERALGLCREVSRVCESSVQFRVDLAEAGFAAFEPRVRWREGYCRNTDELLRHNQYDQEFARLTLLNPDPMYHVATPDQLVGSELMESLRSKRDKDNGVPEAKIADRFPGQIWRWDVDPCVRNLMREQIESPPKFAASWKGCLDSTRAVLENEVHRHFGADFKPAKAVDPWVLFRSAVEEETQRLSFVFDSKKSEPHSPVFSKELVPGWDICFALESADALYLQNGSASLELRLSVRRQELTGPLRDAPLGAFLIFRYQLVVPEFLGAYTTFRNLGELRLFVKAHVFLYALMSAFIEDAMTRGLRTRA